MGTPANGIFSRYFPRTARLVNEIAHPVDTLEGVLGIGKTAAPPPPDPYMLHNDPDIARATQSFRDAQQDAPMGKMVRGALTKKK
jgi:hypothetical protein